MEELEHTLYGTQVDFGFFWWSRKKNDLYKKVFPDGEFTIDLEGKPISGRKVDWSRPGVSIGKKPMQEFFQKDDQVRITRQSNGVVVVGKLGTRIPTPQPGVEHPLSIKLHETQRDSENPSQFEKAVAEAFSFLGFTTKHIGGKDEPDVFLEDIKAIIDSKTTKEGVISERYINFDAMERYRDNHSASFLAVVAPGFSEGNIRDTSAKKGITLIETEAITKLIDNHALYPYELALISAVLFESEKTVISATDIPSSLVNEDTLIQLSSDILGILKKSGKKSITVAKLNTFYELQGQHYSTDDIEKALNFISTPPFLILQKEGDEFKLTVNLQMLAKKTGLLFAIYSRFSKSS
jgi:hypothetical protein